MVLTILAIMLGLLFPAVQSVREKAREATCKNNLNQLNIAVTHFCESSKSIPAPGHRDFVGGWTIEVLPFLEQGNLRDNLVVGSAIQNASDTLLRPPAILRCPERSIRDRIADEAMWPGHYVLVTDSSRDSFMLSDSPLDVALPWASGPEVPIEQIRRSIGPHRKAFFYASGHQQGVNRMLSGVRAH